MPDVLVLDASALCTLVLREPESGEVQTKVRAPLGKGGSVWTDPIAAVEIVTCARRAVEEGEGTTEALSRAVQDALAHPVRRVQDDHDMSALLRLACNTALSGPEARYLELALGNQLLTFDTRQKHAAKKQGTRLA